MRVLNEEKWLSTMSNNLVIQSLPRGPVPPSHANPCTYVPGGPNKGKCALAGEFSGDEAAAPAFPTATSRFDDGDNLSNVEGKG